MTPAAIQKNISLLRYNTFRVDVKADYFAAIHSREELQALADEGISRKAPVLILGGGSNILFTKDFPGLVLHNRISGISKIEETEDEVILEAGAGTEWDHFAEYCTEHHYHGVENLSLIPGTVGAAAVQNIGAYGAEAGETILEVKGTYLLRGEEKTFDNASCRFGYRNSIFKSPALRSFFITSVRFRLSKHPRLHLTYPPLAEAMKQIPHPSLRDVRQAVIGIRRSKLPDPADTGNAGSFFKNPVISKERWQQLAKDYPQMPHYELQDGRVKIPAAWLIEQCGWKEKQSGSCAVWHRQPLVIVNTGKARGREILAFSQEIQESVKRKFGILPEPEVLIL